MDAPRLLLVEDNPDDVLFLKRAFAAAGLQCTLDVAEDGQEAVEKLAARRPTHVLLDLKLPRRPGLEVLAWLRLQPALAGLPVIILTSSNVKSDADRARELGVDAFLVKPISTRELRSIVDLIAQRWGLAALK